MIAFYAGQRSGDLMTTMLVMVVPQALAAVAGYLVMPALSSGGGNKPQAVPQVLELVETLGEEGSAFIDIGSGFVRRVR